MSGTLMTLFVVESVLTAAAILIAASSLGGIINFGYSKSYIRDAGDWLATHVPPQASLYANDIQLMYYADHYGYQIFEQRQAFSAITSIAHGKWKQYDYLALRLEKKDSREDARLLSEINRQPLTVFKNRRGDRVAIYQVSRGGV